MTSAQFTNRLLAEIREAVRGTAGRQAGRTQVAERLLHLEFLDLLERVGAQDERAGHAELFKRYRTVPEVHHAYEAAVGIEVEGVSADYGALIKLRSGRCGGYLPSRWISPDLLSVSEHERGSHTPENYAPMHHLETVCCLNGKPTATLIQVG